MLRIKLMLNCASLGMLPLQATPDAIRGRFAIVAHSSCRGIPKRNRTLSMHGTNHGPLLFKTPSGRWPSRFNQSHGLVSEAVFHAARLETRLQARIEGNDFHVGSARPI